MDKVKENVIEILWEYESLDAAGKLLTWDQITHKFSRGTVAASDLLKEDFCRWAEEFESVLFDCPDDYLTNIGAFAREKILGKYGAGKPGDREVLTQWTKATADPWKAAMSLMSCLEEGYDAWIEVRKNGDQAFPILRKNPELDNPFNWTQSYGCLRTKENFPQYYFNETEEDLTRNWTYCFGEADAIEEYQRHGTVTKAMFNGESGHPVRIEDANLYRERIVGDGYRYDTTWMTVWQAKDGIPYNVVDDRIGDVFTICHFAKGTPVCKEDAMRKAALFLMAYAKKI